MEQILTPKELISQLTFVTVDTLTFISVAILLVAIIIPFCLRKVVPTNEVHIIQSRKKTLSFGKDMDNGNTYYLWPSWIPALGVTRIILPVSVFDLDLEEYEAYDKGRLPFVIDVKAFFRINDSNVSAQRVNSYHELLNQLKAIVQGAVRTILASNEIEEIMQGRATFGEQFTSAVNAELTQWGVVAVKNIELMDIRDHSNSSVIKNIMDKKKSEIEKESRIEVSKNKRDAQLAEIQNNKTVEMGEQQAQLEVGQATAEKDKKVGIAKEQSIQEILSQEKVTKEKEMEVNRVTEIKTAEIAKDKLIIVANQDKDVNIIQAEGNKQKDIITAEGNKQKSIIVAEGLRDQTMIHAEGNLVAKQRESEGIELEGKAKASAELAMQLAPVTAQITLAKEIGENSEYQHYLLSVRKIESDQAIGVEQAKALVGADVKIIANTGEVIGGVNKVMDLFSSKGGTELGGMLEALSNTDAGKSLMNKITGTKTTSKEK